MKSKRILIAGEGGQGVQVLAKIIVKSAFDQGINVAFLPNFGVEQRGGVSLAYIQIGSEPISFPKFKKADLIVLTAPRAIKRIESYYHNDSLLIFDNYLIQEKLLDSYKIEKLAVPASYLAKEKLIPKVFNMILLGTLSAELGLKANKVEKTIEEFFKEKIKKEPQLKHFNLCAFEIGTGIVEDLSKEVKWRQKLIKK